MQAPTAYIPASPSPLASAKMVMATIFCSRVSSWFLWVVAYTDTMLVIMVIMVIIFSLFVKVKVWELNLGDALLPVLHLREYVNEVLA